MSFNDNLLEISNLIAYIEDNDLINRQTTVLNRLGTIRVAKRKLIDNVQILMDNDMGDESKTAELIQRLIQSYDSLKNQEKEFVSTMKQISEDFSKDLDNILPKLNETKEQLQKTSETQNVEQQEKMMSEGETCSNSEEIESLISKFNNMKKMITEIGNLSKETIDSSVLLDEQLKMRLEIYLEMKRKKALLQQLQKPQIAKNTPSSTQKLEQVASVNSNSDRKQRQLERLRRAAIRRGIVNNNEAIANDTVKDEKQKSISGINQQEITEENIRIPPIPKFPTSEASVNPDISDKKKNELREKISERFLSIEAKKQRMRNLQSKLNILQKQKMEKTYDDALKRFKNLTEMRKRLEELQNACEKSESDHTANNTCVNANAIEESSSNAIEAVNVKEKSADSVETHLDSAEDLNGSTSAEDNHPSMSTNELVREIRHAFNATFNKSPATLNKFDMTGTSLDSQTTVANFPGSSSFESAFSTLGDRLKAIESILHNHTDQLIWIGNQPEDTILNELQTNPDDRSLANIDEGNSDQVKQIIMQRLNEFFEKEFGEDKLRTVDTELASKILRLIMDELLTIFPANCYDKVRSSFPVIIEGIISMYLAKQFGEIKQQLVQELSDALQSELSFIFLISRASTLAVD